MDAKHCRRARYEQSREHRKKELILARHTLTHTAIAVLRSKLQSGDGGITAALQEILQDIRASLVPWSCTHSPLPPNSLLLVGNEKVTQADNPETGFQYLLTEDAGTHNLATP